MLTANETNNNQYYFICFMTNLMKSINDNKSEYSQQCRSRRGGSLGPVLYKDKWLFMSYLIESRNVTDENSRCYRLAIRLI